MSSSLLIPVATRTHRSVRSVPRKATPAHVYRRRRLVVAVVSALLVMGVVTLGGALTGSGGVPASASGAGDLTMPTTIVVQPGDTLWSLAHAHRGEVPHGRYLDYIVRLNGGASVRAGQVLRLP